MNEPTTNPSIDVFLAALAGFTPAAVVEFKYYIHFDAATRNCATKSTEKSESCLELSREEYEAIAFCPHYRVTADNKLVKKRVDYSSSKLLQLSDTGFRTMKDNNIFVVDDTYTGETDNWTLRELDESDN